MIIDENLIARHGRAVFKPTNLSEVGLRFARLLARTEGAEIAEADELDADTPAEDRVKANRRTPFRLAGLLLRLRARALPEDKRRRSGDHEWRRS